MKRLLVAASAALLLAGASGAAFAQDRAPAPVATPAVWNGQGDANLATKVEWRRDWRHDRRDWRRDHRDWRHDRRDWYRNSWRHDRRDWHRYGRRDGWNRPYWDRRWN
jgi:opacity protein-like surface antigen